MRQVVAYLVEKALGYGAAVVDQEFGLVALGQGEFGDAVVGQGIVVVGYGNVLGVSHWRGVCVG